MLTKIINFVKINISDIILIIGVLLISSLSFSIGYITAKYQEKEPLSIEDSVQTGQIDQNINHGK